LQHGQDLRRRHAVLRRRRVVDAHLDLGCEHLLFDLQVGQARNAGELAAQQVGLGAQGVQVIAVDLDGDLRAHAGQHVVDAVRDGLADLDGGGQVDQAGADVGLDVVQRSGQQGGGLEAYIQFADVHPFGMLVQFGAAAAPPDMDHLRHLPHQHLGLPRQGGRFGQGDARIQAQADEQRAFVERRQEGGGEERHRHRRASTASTAPAARAARGRFSTACRLPR
jgi:hypothetical protein